MAGVQVRSQSLKSTVCSLQDLSGGRVVSPSRSSLSHLHEIIISGNFR